MLYLGVGVGGPFDGVEVISRFPKGFLAVDRPINRCWIYDFQENISQFVVRDADGYDLVNDITAPKNRVRAALEDEYDVMVAP